MKNNRFLVFCRASDNSLHKEWIQPERDKNFDLFIEYYGDQSNRFKNDCDFYSHYKDGAKWPRFHQLLRENPSLFDYDAIMLADDDVSMTASTLNRAFQIFTEYDLMLAQPALTRDSYHTHWTTLEYSDCLLHYTSFVECMLPMFSKKALEICWPTFEKCVTGWGLDFVWPKLLGYPSDKIAVIDDAPVKHTRPVFSGDLYYSTGVINPREELNRVLQEYDAIWRVEWLGHIPKK